MEYLYMKHSQHIDTHEEHWMHENQTICTLNDNQVRGTINVPFIGFLGRLKQ